MDYRKLQLLAPVVSNVEVIPNHKVITCIAPEIAEQAVPGHFVNVLVADFTDPLLRKPFSIYKADKKTGEIALLYSIVGQTTRGMARKVPGETLDLFGPLGGSLFNAGQPGIKRHIMVGGGYGVPPLVFLAKTIQESSPDDTVLFVIGARSKLLVVGSDDVEALGLTAIVTTEDGSHGMRGLVTDALSLMLEDQDAASTMVYCCGSSGMMRAVAELSAKAGIACRVSLETPMPCGVGVCMGCVVDLTDGRRVRACVDGPVFDGTVVRWQ